MMNTLTSITKRSTYLFYHVFCTFSDGRLKYLEMRRERTEKTNLCLIRCHRPKCIAKLLILINDQIKTEQTPKKLHIFTKRVRKCCKFRKFIHSCQTNWI